ncbi:DUF551 domain-containing protein [Escherichia coli]|uniref:DUF551 domain-containing protein n=2 Tax=Escherichia coli TaxID=562 RepID=UPI0004470D66|nr:hypothetical protein AB98_4718 [Escherichia coli 1-176-05_S3_C1]
MTTITKERLLTIKQWRETYGPGSNVVLPAEEAEELARIALASLEAEPVASCIIEDGCMCVDGFGEYVGHSLPDGMHQLYTAPPALVVPDEMDLLTCHLDGVTETYADGWNACRAAMLQGSQPVSQTYNLPELIEGMEVSIDVSTCDADLGNRYFGTVTEALELDTAKNGYILLVQDAEPNFDVNGNSPGTPDSWISCSERMPNDAQWCVVDAADGYYVQCWSEGQGWLGDDISLRNCDVIRWMPIPEPPQEVK